MPRTTVFQAESVEFKGKQGLAIVKYLRDNSGELERASGGLWLWLDGETDDVLSRLTNACEQALAFATACESKHAEILRVADQPKKAPKAPTPPPAPVAISAAVAANRAIAEKVAPKAPVAPTAATILPPAAQSDGRKKIIDKARKDRAALATSTNGHVGATARDTGKPAAPKMSAEEEAEQNWLALLGA